MLGWEAAVAAEDEKGGLKKKKKERHRKKKEEKPCSQLPVYTPANRHFSLAARYIQTRDCQRSSSAPHWKTISLSENVCFLTSRDTLAHNNF